MRPEADPLSPDEIRQSGAALQVELTLEQAKRLADFARLLLKWNRIHNLTALKRPQDVLSHHLLDSLAIVPRLAELGFGSHLRMLDVGAGGGLPGIPLAIALPQAHVTLIDCVQKKTAFIEQVRVELGLSNVEVIHARVEDCEAQPFDVVVSRAFAPLAEMVLLTRHLVSARGYWAAMKGAYPSDEVNALPSSVQVVSAVKLRVPLLGAERHLVVLRPC